MNYLVLDTETSGLMDFKKPADAPGQPRVCSIGLIFVNEDLTTESEIEHLIKPNGWRLDNNSEAAKINGLTQEKLDAEGVDIKEVLRTYGESIDNKRIIVGHNCSFDMKLMRAELRFAGMPDRYMQTRSLCTMWGSRDVVGIPAKNGRGFKIPKLIEACDYFGIEQPAKHTALADARSALEILRKLRDAGKMPAYADPYDDRPKKPATSQRPANWQRAAGPDYEQEVINSQDFIGGASEDGK
jgi:DNA polymerase III epsilon subunit-like protein